MDQLSNYMVLIVIFWESIFCPKSTLLGHGTLLCSIHVNHKFDYSKTINSEMNSAERKILKRKTCSRDGWKTRATAGVTEIRRLKSENKKLRKSRDDWKGKAAKQKKLNNPLNRKIRELTKSRNCVKTELVEIKKTENTQITTKNRPPNPSEKNQTDQKMYLIYLSLSLVFSCSVSHRSVPKILNCLKQNSDLFDGFKIPHYTTIIRWVCRLGCYLLKRPNRRQFSERSPWICIADHTIQVGTNKALAILGVPLKAMELGRALTLKDVTVLDVVVKKSWTGEEVKKSLGKVFKKNAPPIQIVIDGAANLNKGARDVIKEMDAVCHVTYDITHFIAKLMKKKYDNCMTFLTIMKKLSLTSKQIAQTDIGYLAPPKLREKARFLNLPKTAEWFQMILDLPKILRKRDQKKLLKKYFDWIHKPKLEEYINQFITDILNLKEAQKILKNIGISDSSYEEACTKLSDVSDNELTRPIIDKLMQELEFSKQIGVPALLTSDLIESLFGKFKTISKPHKLFEINKLVLAIPCLCEEITLDLIERAFSKMTNKETEKWIEKYIPITLFARRIAIVNEMKKNKIKKKKKEKVKKDQETIELHQKSTESDEACWAS